MKKPRTIDKVEARERRDKLSASAAAADLSITDGVREMRAISGMTQQEFATHRGISARALKALELGQGNPTVATLNRIAKFYGLEVAFVPIKKIQAADADFTFDPAFDVMSRSEEFYRGLKNFPSLLEEHLKAANALNHGLESVKKFNDQLKRAESVITEMEKTQARWVEYKNLDVLKEIDLAERKEGSLATTGSRTKTSLEIANEDAEKETKVRTRVRLKPKSPSNKN